MPFGVGSVLLANETFAPLSGFNPEGILAATADAQTVLEAAVALGLLDVLSEQNGAFMAEFLAAIPPSLDAAVLAAVRSALARGVRVQLTWQPAYDFELRLWEASEGSAGLANVHILSPHPPESSES